MLLLYWAGVAAFVVAGAGGLFGVFTLTQSIWGMVVGLGAIIIAKLNN